MLPIAVLVSGSGTNLQAIIDAAATDPDFGAQLVAVISDRLGVQALDRAVAAGIPHDVVDWSEQPSREAFTKSICESAEFHRAEALILAGFMRVLSAEAIARYPSRILNIHPSLLPAFPGVRAVEAALDHGSRVTGVTIHFVDEKVDHGPIIAQTPVEIRAGDTAESLQERIQQVEHQLYPKAIKAFAHGRLEVIGRTVRWS